ncbi:PepSY domain-containing protein [Pseudomaricurvus sp. HS19]|uniref:PepSY-associated TM helix domain-containing protein n=1 Tax=Pseudomaricurvus sp. HS19 TaxID=2692626 RepID=UPI00136A4153|nr:PepSY-associated TM helix domain-containing protein [Pseudomaricurvus sp. HS19]MYM61844.1 PepSY domain-containing protein [Pseudomaricurvus sp. HS19]
MPRKRGLWFWHRWLGVLTLVMLLVTAVSGALLVYKQPLLRLLVAEGATLPAGFDRQALLQELDRLAETLPADEPVLIKAPSDEEPYWTLRYSGVTPELYAIGSLQRYEANPWLGDLMAWLFRLHTELLLGEPGEWLLLIAAFGGVVLAVTGVVLWWPARRGFRWRMALPWPIRRPLMLHYHRHAGVVAALPLLLVLLTAAVMMWQIMIKPLLPPLAETTQPMPRSLLASESSAGHGISASAAMMAAWSVMADGWPSYIRLPQGDNNQYRIRFRLPGEWHPNGRTSVTLDVDGETLRVTQRADEVSSPRRLLNAVYPLHSGHGMNSVYALLVFLAGLFLLWSCVTGFVSWRRRR